MLFLACRPCFAQAEQLLFSTCLSLFLLGFHFIFAPDNLLC
jgi:hypothetical protein